MQHCRTQHPTNRPLVSVKKQRKPAQTPARKRKQAFDVFETIYLDPEESTKYDLAVFYNSVREELRQHIETALDEKKAVKWHLLVKVVLVKTSVDGEEEMISPFFHTNTCAEFTIDRIDQHLDEGLAKITNSFEKFLQRGSGWVLKEISYLELKIARYEPLKGSSYMPLPKELKGKEAILNIQNFSDEKCFLWCVLAHKMHLSFKDNAERVSKYAPYEDTINMAGVQYPVPYQRIPAIEDANNLRINVYGFEDGEIYVLFVSDKEQDDVINLLLISDGENCHYTLIRNFSRFMAHRTNYQHVLHYCYRCLHGFTRQDLLDDHLPHCRKQAAQAIKMPKEGDNFLQFTSTHLQHPVAYTIYADFEALLVPVNTAAPSDTSSYNMKTSQHIPCGYAYVIVDSHGHSVRPIKVYRGEDAVDHFIEEMLGVKEELGRKLTQVAPMRLSPDEERAFHEATECSICHKPLGPKRVRDHDHISSAFRGAAHAFCNLNYKQSTTIPVIFHNLKNYDGHHIMCELGKQEDHKVDVIAATLEKYITFKIRKEDSRIQLAFLDSLQFLPASLEKLAQNLDHHQFAILKENFAPNTDLSLLTRKGVYPYEYIDKFEKFDETILPPKSAFYSSLSEEGISDSDYAHAQDVWATFQLKNLGEFHDLYVKTDVLLLADIFQNFRQICLQHYQLDPAHLVTLPGLSWQSCLKMTGVSLELFTDPNMLLFIEQGVRGGVSQISHRFATANNSQVPGYDPTKPTSHIMYWDANNLYGWAMSQYLPHGGFQWVAPDSFNEQSIRGLKKDDPIGYIFEVDLKYPESLHDSHNEYPLAPEKITIQEPMLSPYAKGLLTHPFRGTPKLVPNLMDKTRYITHYRNLQLYLELGMELTRIHRVLKFNQSPWLESYISFNTEQRKIAKSNFERDFFKLLNNSIYGKCIENLRKRRNIELCNNRRRASKLVASPNFKSFKQFNDHLVGVEKMKPAIFMNRPIYVGFTILELSKVHMYEFHYGFIKKAYENRALLLFTDTDSLTYHLTTENLQKDMEQHAAEFDFSEYPTSHPLYSTVNKKVIGKFKDEMNGEAVHQFLGLKSKMYSIKTAQEEKKRAKGISTRIVRKKLRHQDYVDCLQNEQTTYEVQKRIAQQSHRLFTIAENKKCLSPFDDKRYLLEDGITSYAYGHYAIPS